MKHDEDYRAAEARAEALGTRVDLKWEEEIIALTDLERHRLKDAILAEPPTDMRDLAIKVIVNSGDGSWGLDNTLTLECARIAGRDFDQLPGILFKQGLTQIRVPYDFCGQAPNPRATRFSIGRIREAHAWLNETLGGDTSRANSLVRVGQDSGLLTNSGRGRGSPPLAPADFPALICLALTFEGPTKAPEAVRRLWEMPLCHVACDSGVGFLTDVKLPTLREEQALTMQELGPTLEKRRLQVHYDKGQTDTTCFDVLNQLFTVYAPGQDFLRFDEIEYVNVGQGEGLRVVLRGPAFEDTNYPRGKGKDDYLILLAFGFSGEFGTTKRISTTRTLGADALNALYLLTPNRTKGAE